MPDSIISMNDDGAVAFWGWAGRSRYAILVGNGGPVSAVVDRAIHTQFGQVLRPSINNAGAVAFTASTTTIGADTVAVAQGAIATITGPGTPTPTTGVLAEAHEPALNNSGVVRVVGSLAGGGAGIFAGSGGPLTPIALHSTSPFAGINDLGRAAFVVTSDSVRWGDRRTADDCRVDADLPVVRGEASFNSASVVAFWARLGPTTTGIFIGPNPATDAVIKSGDVIPGVGTVSSVSMSEEAINDAGRVAFTAYFQAGTGTIAGESSAPIRSGAPRPPRSASRRARPRSASR